MNGGYGRKPGGKRGAVKGWSTRPEERFRVRTVSVAFPVSNDGSRLVPPPNARCALTAPARSMCGSYSYCARGQIKIPNDIKLLRKVLRLRTATHKSAVLSDAGWSSPVARQAHNLKAAGSNPAPAPKYKPPAWITSVRAGLCLLLGPRQYVAARDAGADRQVEAVPDREERQRAEEYGDSVGQH